MSGTSSAVSWGVEYASSLTTIVHTACAFDRTWASAGASPTNATENAATATVDVTILRVVRTRPMVPSIARTPSGLRRPVAAGPARTLLPGPVGRRGTWTIGLVPLPAGLGLRDVLHRRGGRGGVLEEDGRGHAVAHELARQVRGARRGVGVEQDEAEALFEGGRVVADAGGR